MNTVDPAVATQTLAVARDEWNKLVASRAMLRMDLRKKCNTVAQARRVFDSITRYLNRELEFMYAVRNALRVQGEIIEALFKYLDAPADNGKRWTYEETELAVSLRAGDVSIEDIAFRLNRSPAAVAQRISQAVGIRRLEQEIRGHISGNLDGEGISGEFSGVWRRKS